MSLALENPGIDGITSDVRVTSFAMVLVDSLGETIARPGDWFSQLRIHGPTGIHLERMLGADEDSVLVLDPISDRPREVL